MARLLRGHFRVILPRQTGKNKVDQADRLRLAWFRRNIDQVYAAVATFSG